MDNARESLLEFLNVTLEKRVRARICGFASKKKTERKFLAHLDHDLGHWFRASVIVEELSDSAWSCPAFAFVSPDKFGIEMDSLRDAYARFGQGIGEGVLLISTESRFGIWCDHSYVDVRTFVAADLRTDSSRARHQRTS